MENIKNLHSFEDNDFSNIDNIVILIYGGQGIRKCDVEILETNIINANIKANKIISKLMRQL